MTTTYMWGWIVKSIVGSFLFRSDRMTKYRAIVTDLDQTFKFDNGLGYKVLSTLVTFWAGMVTYSVLLDLGVIV